MFDGWGNQEGCPNMVRQEEPLLTNPGPLDDSVGQDGHRQSHGGERHGGDAGADQAGGAHDGEETYVEVRRHHRARAPKAVLSMFLFTPHIGVRARCAFRQPKFMTHVGHAALNHGN